MKYKMMVTGPGDRTITLVGVNNIDQEDGYATIRVGVSVKNPADEDNEELAAMIAEGRAYRKPTFMLAVKSARANSAMLTTFTESCATAFVDSFSVFVPLSANSKGQETTSILGVSTPRRVEAGYVREEESR